METLEGRSLKGQLMFTGSGYIKPGQPYQPRSWTLIQNDGTEIDLRPIIMSAIQNMDGESARHIQEIDAYSIILDPESDFRIDHFEAYPQLRNKIGSGLSNVNAYLSNTLVWITGRKIEVTINQSGLFIQADKTEKVFEVQPRNDASDCPVSDHDAETVCGVNQDHGRCIFSGGKSGEFYCSKFGNVVAFSILDAFAEKRLRPQWTRIGNCTMAVRDKKIAS